MVTCSPVVGVVGVAGETAATLAWQPGKVIDNINKTKVKDKDFIQLFIGLIVNQNLLPDSFTKWDADERGKRGKEHFLPCFFNEIRVHTCPPRHQRPGQVCGRCKGPRYSASFSKSVRWLESKTFYGIARVWLDSLQR